MMITIITPSYNRVELITNAIESVMSQDVQNFEHIIIDGGSTDGTIEILKRYPHLKVFSEPDQGMYDALNKGLDIAQGEMIGFLNTDDLYVENVFGTVVRKFDDPDIMAVTGRAEVFSELPGGKAKVIGNYFPEKRNIIEHLAKGGAFFNAWFFRKATFDQIGSFKSDYQIVGDSDFMFRFALSGLKYAMINDLVYKYRMHQDSLTFDKNDEKRARSADEHLAMINFYLVNQNLPDLARKLLIQSRTSETVDMAARSIWNWNYKKFIYYSLEGSRYDPFWLSRFFKYILMRGAALLLAKRSAKVLH